MLVGFGCEVQAASPMKQAATHQEVLMFEENRNFFTHLINSRTWALIIGRCGARV